MIFKNLITNEFDKECQELEIKIKKELTEAQLPQPIDNHRVMIEAQQINQEDFNKIAAGLMAPPSSLHLQAIRYLHALNTSFAHHMDEIIPHIFVGSLQAYVSIDRSQFTRVISLIDWGSEQDETLTKIIAPIEENRPWAEISQQFESLFEIIDLARKQKQNLLIHCSQGMSRSVSLMMAYLMRRFHLTYDEALRYVKMKRFIAQPTTNMESFLKAIYGII